MIRPSIAIVMCCLFLLGLFHTEMKAQSYPGARKITCKRTAITLEELFRLVYEQTGMTAFYNDEQLSSFEKVSVDFRNEQLDNVLARLLRRRGMAWCYRKDVFVIAYKRDSDVDLGYIPGEDKRFITGIVVDEKEVPLEAVVVVTGDLTNSKITGKDGRFWLRDVGSNATLLVQRLGYKPVILSSYADSIYVRMFALQAPLQPVNVTGKVQANLTGSVSRITAKEIQESPVSNVLGALQGRVPGLYLNQTTGLPGGGYRIRLRGRNSIESNNDPLILVDGIPFPTTSFNENAFNTGTTTGANVAASPLNLLSVNDIAGIQILKDADATALYGTKGANGVILISSKQPDEHKKHLAASANYYSGIGHATNLVRYLDTKEYLVMRKEAIHNDNRTPDSTLDYDLLRWDTTKYRDWQKEMIGGTAQISDGSLQLKGGGSNFGYRASGSYRKENTVYPKKNFYYNKGGAMLQLWFRSRDQRFSAGFSGTYVADHNRLPIRDMTVYSVIIPPNAPEVYNADGKLNFAGGKFPNPYGYMLQVTDVSSRNFRPSVNLLWEPVKALTFTAAIGGSSIVVSEAQRSPAASFNPATGVDYGIAQFSDDHYKNGLLDLRTTWKRAVKMEQIQLTVGARFQFEEQSKKAHYAWGYAANDVVLWDTSTAENILPLDSIQTNFHYQSFYGRLEYKHADKYVLTLTANRDGSTRLIRQYATFGAVGAAWIFSREPWFRRGRLLSYGKLRASYGFTGNDRFERNVDQGAYVPGPLFSTRGTSLNYGWEKIRKSEIAMDLAAVNDRISATICYYNNRSTDQLLAGRFQTIAGDVSGEQFVPVNVPAVVDNTGLEIDLEGRVISKGVVDWNMNLSLSFNQNRLRYFPYFDQSPYKYYYSEGKSLDMIKGFHLKGVDPQTGVYRFEDRGLPGLSWEEDRKYSQEKGPFFFAGWYNNVRYNQFEVTCLLRYTRQNNDSYQYFPNFKSPGAVVNQPISVLERWQKPGDAAPLQRFTTSFVTSAGDAFFNAIASDRQLTDASFFRLQSVVLAYHIPAKNLERIKIKSCKLYVQGLNLFTISNYNGRDPEVTAGPDSYPSLRIITAGVQLSL